MKTARCHLKSVSPLQFSRYYGVDEAPKKEKESPDDYERRTWRHRAHYDKDGKVFIPPMMFKKSLEEAAKFLSLKIPGKGQATWTKHFLAGTLVVDPLYVGITKDELEPLTLFVPADGVRGSGKRVSKIFPILPQWEGKIDYLILDDTITEKAFLQHIAEAGKLIGIGAFRPRSGGYFGRYKVEKCEWIEGAEVGAA